MTSSKKLVREILKKNRVIQYIADNSRCVSPFYIIDEAISVLDAPIQNKDKYDNARTIVKSTLGNIAAQKAKEISETDKMVLASGRMPCRAMLPNPEVHSIKALQEINELFNERAKYSPVDFFVKEGESIRDSLEQIMQENGLANTALGETGHDGKDYTGYIITFSDADKLSIAQIDNLGKELRHYAQKVKHGTLKYYHNQDNKQHLITLTRRQKWSKIIKNLDSQVLLD